MLIDSVPWLVGPALEVFFISLWVTPILAAFGLFHATRAGGKKEGIGILVLSSVPWVTLGLIRLSFELGLGPDPPKHKTFGSVLAYAMDVVEYVFVPYILSDCLAIAALILTVFVVKRILTRSSPTDPTESGKRGTTVL